MKILFTPCHIGGYAHFIPLLVLNKMLEGTSHTAAFLLSKHAKENYSPYYAQFNLDVLKTDYNGTLRSAQEAYSAFKPDVIVDDFSLSARFLCHVHPTARVTIQRTGIFPFEKRANVHHKHSSSVCDNKFSDVTALGMQPLRTLSDLFTAEVKIVPGIRSLEVLPAELQQDSSYYFSGPLILNDAAVPADLNVFFNRNKQRKKVYLTYGSAQKPPVEINQCLEYILKSNIALVTNVEHEGYQQQFPDTFYYSQYLPMHFICSRVDMAIHHCGSATYHYPVLHQLNTITIGTQCYDRENVAIRLKDAGVSEHIPSPAECANFVQEFKNAFDRQLNEPESARAGRVFRQGVLIKEIEAARSSFDFNKALNDAIFFFQARPQIHS